MSQGTPKRTINHFMHTHPLTEAVVGTYTCNGCKLYGEGKTYRCNDCDYDLHEYCATCLPTLRNTLHAPDHELNLINAPTHMAERGCYVCRLYIQGMFYKCNHCSFESHPLCTYGPIMHASSPDATLIKQRSLHDPSAQPSSPHHYGQGNHYGYANMGLYPNGGGGGYHPHHQHEHQIQHPYMNPVSPKADPKPDSSKGKKKNRGFFEGVQAALAVTATAAAQFAVATVAEEYLVYEE